MTAGRTQPIGMWLAVALAIALPVVCAAPSAQAQDRFLGREEITLYGIGLQVQPAQQTVPKGFATIVSTYLQTPQSVTELPPFAADAEVRATLRGPSFPEAIDLSVRPNSPFTIPVLTVPGTHTLENIRLVSGGEVLLYGSPQSAKIEVIEKLLVTTVTARPLTAEEIREKGIVFDKSDYQAYNFTAAFAISDGSEIKITFPVVLPTLAQLADVGVSESTLASIDAPVLRSLETLIPDTLRIGARIPNLTVTGFTLSLDSSAGDQDFYVPPIPGVIVIPGDIGFLNQFFSVMLMVGNVAPTGSNLVVSDLTATIVLPPGLDNVVGSADDPLKMARTATGTSAQAQAVVQAGVDGRLGTGDDIATLGPGETGNAEYLVEGLREGTWTVEMEMAGTLNGMPVGPVPIRGRAAGVVLVRNPNFTLTFTHPDVVNAGEPYTLDVTVTNTSASPANYVSVNLYPQNISGARLDDDPTKSVDSIASGDSATMTFRLVSQRTGRVTAATLDSAEQVAGRFALKTGVGEFGVPLSPDSLVLPKESGSLPTALREATLALLGRAWAVATAPPAVFPKDLERFSKQIVLDRAIETAEAGFRILLGSPVPQAAADLWMDMLGSEYTRLSQRVEPTDPPETLSLLQADVRGFDLLRRKSVRGDVFADQMAVSLAPWLGMGSETFHRGLAGQLTTRPGHLSVLVAGNGIDQVPVEAVLTDSSGRRLGGFENSRLVREIPHGDQLTFKNGDRTTAQLLLVAVPEAGEFTVALTRRADADLAATYSVSIAYPAADGSLRFAIFPALGALDVPTLQQDAGDPYRVLFSLAGVGSPQVQTASGSAVTNPPPNVLGAVQMAEADVVGCSASGLENRRMHAGRVVAVLFSEEVTAESVQDVATDGAITAFKIDGNRVVDVALQPGNRIAYVALREPIGRFVSRTLTVEGVADAQGNVLASASVPIQPTVTDEGGVVSGRVLNADGTPAAHAELRLFYEFQCDEEGTVVIGIASEFANENGEYQFDFVSMPVPAVKMVAINTGSDDLRTQRFRVARDGQLLNLNIVFIGRGAFAGRTLAEDGVTALARTAVRVTSLTDQSQYGATSDSTGAFEIPRIPVGNILVEAVNTARQASVFLSDYIPTAGSTVTRDLILLDAITQAITVKTGTVTGRVLRSDGVTRVPGVQVVAYYASESQTGVKCGIPPGSLSLEPPSECAIAITTTGDDGAFSLGKIAAGSLRLYTFDQTVLQEGAVRLTLTENEVIDLNLLLGGGLGTVTGVVLDGSGNPVTDAEVGGGLSVTKVNEADGTFTLTDVPVGRREIVAVSQSLGATGRTTVDIVRAGEVVNAAIRLEAVGAVAGIVRDFGGAVQAGINVYALQKCFDPEGNEVVCVRGEATTDASGAYRINNLATGQYTVSAFLPDLSDGNLLQVAIRYHQQVLKADITFRGAGGTVAGRVLKAKPVGCVETDPTCVETPLAAKVAVSGDRLVTAGGIVGVRFEWVQNYRIVDNNLTTGEYSFSQVWTGPFTVRAAGLFSPEPVSGEGTMPGPGQTVNVDLRLQPTSVITGVVLEPDGVTPATGRQVALKFHSNAVIVFCSEDSGTGMSSCTEIPQGIQEEYAVTDAETGRFSFPLVNAGAFTVTATDPGTGSGGHVAEIKGAVKAGETLDLSVRLLGSGRATIRVYQHDGQTLVPNATVELQQIGYPKESRSGTAVDGTIAFEGLSEGQFVVKALGPGGFAGRASGAIASVGGDTTVNVYLYDATGTVTGLVTRLNSTGTGVVVPNAEVILSVSGTPIAFAVTDASGIYTVTLVPVGAFSVEAFDPVTAGRGRASGLVTGGTVPIEANVLLDALGVIRGAVLESGTLEPLKGWQVRLSQTSPSGRSLPALMTMTSVDGSFSFPGASVGSFTVSTWKSGVVGGASASGQVSRAGQLVEVPLVVTIVRRVTGTVAGTVFNPDGSIASSAQIDVCPASEACHATVNSPDGLFSIPDIPLGRFTVKAHAQVTGNQSVGTTGGTLLFEGDTAQVSVTLMGLSSVSGHVYELVNSVLTPAAFASVLLYGQPGSGCPGACQQSTDAVGAFTFTNIPARTFTVTASLGGQKGSVGDTLNPGETKTGVQIILAPAVSLMGKVRLASGSPAMGIVADLTSGGTHLFAESGEDGVFTFDAVGTGAYSLMLQDPVGPGIAKLTGTIVAGTPVNLGDILLDEQPPAVAATSPASGAPDVGLTPEILITFTEAINPATVTAGNVSVTGPQGTLTGLLDVVSGDKVVRFRLLTGSSLADHTRYTVRVSGIEDRLGKKMESETVVTFTTVDMAPPSILETTPIASASGVSIETVVRIKYSELFDPAKFAGSAITVSAPGGAIAGTIAYILGNTVAVFTPTLPLAQDTTYAVHVAPATDLSGVTQPAGLDFTFTTTDGTPPQVTALVAANSGRVIENTITTVTASVAAGDVAFVDFYINGALALTSRTAPYILSFQATSAYGTPGGQISVVAVATDTSGNRGAAVSTSITIIADAVPTAAITSPAQGLQAGSGDLITVRAHATDDVGLARAGYVARTAAGTISAATSAFTGAPLDATAQFTFYVPATLAPGTVITVEASAVDTKAQATQAIPVTLSVLDSLGPTVEITGVTSGERVRPGQHVTVVVTASDAGQVAQIGFGAAGAGVAKAELRPVSPAQASVTTSFSFDVPAGAQSNEQIAVSAYAIDVAGNRTDAAQKILPMADGVPPTVTLRTSSGSLHMVPGTTVSIVVDGSDDLALATLALTGSGAFTVSDSFSITSPVSMASHTFVINVPADTPIGATLTLTARATDVSGNLSTPVSLTLTARSVSEVTLPESVVLRAGEQKTIDVVLTAPATSVTVVGLESSAAGVATVTSSVTFVIGETQKAATVTGIAGGTAQITAKVSGIARATSTVTVQGGVVTGTVTDAAHNPVAGAQVTIFHGGAPITTVTDANGAFDVESVVGSGPTGRALTVRASSDGTLGYADALLSVPGGYASVTVILVPLSTIAGTVFHADGATPAGESVQVDLYEAASPSTVIGTTFTDASSRFELRLVAQGSYILKASDIAGHLGRTTTTVGTSGQEVTANVSFLGQGIVTGTVRDGAGNAVPYATLELHSSSIFGSVTRTGAAAADGTFSFNDVLIGTFTVTAYDQATTRGGSTSGQITTAGQTVDVTVTLASYGNVEGTVFRSDGTTTVSGATVTVTCGGATRSTTTATNGHYAFSILPFASFTIKVQDGATRALGAASGTGFPQSGATVTADVVLQAQGAVLVTVRNSVGTPVNGASVTVTVSKTVNGVVLTDSLTATTSQINSVDGLALLSPMMVGAFTASASYSGLAGSGSGTITEGGQAELTIQLEAPPPVGTITGMVYDQDGQTPAGGSITARRTTYPYYTYSATLVGGSYTLSSVRLGTYRLEARDTTNRLRAVTTDVLLAADGQVETRNLTFIGLGRVLGTVTNPFTGVASNITVQVRSAIATFGGTWATTTGAAGEYTISGVPVGPITVAAWSSDGQLRAEAARTLSAPGQDLTVDLVLENNTFTTAFALFDANDSGYSMLPAGDKVTGGVKNVLSTGVAKLDVVLNGTATRFTGQSYGTYEDGGRETVARQVGLQGLNVVRKFFVPVTGYFTRVLEAFTNPTTADITVDVVVTSDLSPASNNAPTLWSQMTSSGNSEVEIDVGGVHDNWVVMDDAGDDVDPYYASTYGVPIALVYDGPGATRLASGVQAGPNQLRATWQSVTIPAGGTVTLMHFIAQQVNRPAAVDSAARLVQLPPEALDGLDADEITSVVNFAVPEDGQSALERLPALTGVVDGHVFEADNLTPVAGATVYVRSLHPLFGRVWSTTADVSGYYALTGAPRKPVPLAGTELRAKHPVVSSTYSPFVLGELTDAAPALTQDLVFSDTGRLTGYVRRHTGAVVTSGSVTITRSGTTYATVAIGVDGGYSVGGLPATTSVYTLAASLPAHPQGTGLTSVPVTTIISAGKLTTTDIQIVPTGTLDGTLIDGSGVPVAGRSVEWFQPNGSGGYTFYRSTNTDAAGKFVSSDMPVGTYTARSNTPTNFPVTITFAITQDAATPVTLSYPTPGTLTVTVRRASGTAVGAGVSVRLTGNFSLPYGTTDTSGQAVFANVPRGTLVTVTVVLNSYVQGVSYITLQESSGGTGEITVWLPAYGSVQGTVTLPNGNPLAGPSAAYVGIQALSLWKSVGAAYVLDGVPVGTTYLVQTYRSGDATHYRNVPVTLRSDGEVAVVNTHVPALATVRVTVQQPAGTPLVGAQVRLADACHYLFCTPVHPTGVTNASGVTQFTSVVEGDLAVAVYPATPALPPDYNVCNGYANPAELETVRGRVTAGDDGATLDLQVVPTSFTVSINGLVTLADGVTPVANQAVSVYRAADYGQIATRTTDAAGAFSVESASVTGAGVIARVASPGGTGSVDTIVPVTADGPVTVNVVTPALIAAVSGQVFASDGVTPVMQPLQISLRTSSGSVLATTTLDQGHYAFPARALGTEGVRVRALVTGVTNGYIEQLSGAITENNQLVTVNLQLPLGARAARITGRVVTTADHVTPVPNAGVYVHRRDNGASIIGVATDANGTYTIDAALPADGLFTIRAQSPFNSNITVDLQGSAASDNATVEMATIELRVSMLTGHVTYADGTPVPSPTVIARHTDGATESAYSTDAEGKYLFLGLPIVTLTVVANDTPTGLHQASALVQIPSEEALVTADLTMPETGTVSVTVLDESGAQVTDATLALMSDKVSFERRGGATEAVKPNADGRYIFVQVPVGGVYVQATRTGDTFASASGMVATAGGTLELVVSFQHLGSVQGTVLNRTTNEAVSVTIDALGSAGPLGVYSRTVSLPDGTDQFSVAQVPPGTVRVQASTDWSTVTAPAAQAIGDLAADATEPLTIDVTLGTATSFYYSYGTIDLACGSFTCSVDAAGTLTSSDVYWGTVYEAAQLKVGAPANGSSNAAGLEMNGRQLVIGPQVPEEPLLPFQVTRKVYVPEDGRFVRYLDVISNPTDAALSVPVALLTPIVRSQPFPEVTAPSPTDGGYLVFNGVSGSAGTSAYVFSGVNPQLYPSNIQYYQPVSYSPQLIYQWNISLLPHESKALLHFIAQDQPDQIAAIRARAQSLANLNEAGELDGLTDDEKTIVVNYHMPGSHLVDLWGRVRTADSVRGIPGATIEVYQGSDSKLLARLTSDGAGIYQTSRLLVWGNELVLKTAGAVGGTLVQQVTVSGDGFLQAPDFLTDWMYASVVGYVTTHDGTHQIQNGHLVQLLTLGEQILAETSVGTESDSTFTFGPRFLPAEGMLVRVFVPGLPGGYVQFQSETITGDGQQVNGDLSLPESIYAIFHGVVRSVGSDEPVQSAPVSLWSGGALITQMTVARDGMFDFAVALPADGAYTVRAEAPTGSGSYTEVAGNAGQGESIDVADFRLAVTTATGLVTFAGGAAVPWPTVFAVGEDGLAWFATISREDGTFAFYELPVGTYRLTAHDPATGLTATRSEPFTLDTTTSSIADLTWALPPTGTVTVTARDNSGQPTTTATVALVADALAFERRIGPNDAVKPANGIYTFEKVPLGFFYLQGTWEMCTGCQYLYASAAGELRADNTPLAAQVSFGQYYGQVNVTVTNPGTGTTLFVLDPLGSAGPLGTSFQAVAQSSSTWLFGNVPPGPFRVMVQQDGLVGAAQGVVVQGAAVPAEVSVALGNAADFTATGTVNVDDAEGFRYTITNGGVIASGGTTAGTLVETLFNAAALHIGDNPVCCVAAGEWSEVGRQITIGPVSPPTARGLVVTRKVFVSPPNVGRGFARYLDRVANPTGVPITVTLSLRSAVRAGATRGVSSRVDPSATTGGYAVIGGAEGQYGVSAYVFSGVNPPVVPSLVSFDFSRTDVVRYNWTVTIAAHSSVALLHFVTQRLPGSEVDTAGLAQALVDLTENDALTGLSAEDYAGLLNYHDPGAPVEIPDEWSWRLDAPGWWLGGTWTGLPGESRVDGARLMYW